MSESLNSLYMRDPEAANRRRRYALAEALQKQGTDTSPTVGTGNTSMQAIARIIQGGLGGLLAAHLDGQAKAEAESNRAAAAGWDPTTPLAQSLAGSTGGQAPMTERLGGAPPAEGPAPVPPVQREPMAAPPGGRMAVPDQYRPLLEAASARTGIPGGVLAALLQNESGGNPNAVGDRGHRNGPSRGLMQIQEATARQPGYGLQPVDPARLTDPATNINFGADYLAARGRAAGVTDWNDPAQQQRGLAAYSGSGPQAQAYGQRVAGMVGQSQPAQQPQGGSFLVGQPQGLVAPGNIDLNARPRVRNADGSISTVRSMGVNIDGKEVLIPTVSDDGRIMSDREAVDTYRRTGRHLGMFASPEASTAYAHSLHGAQERQYVGTEGQGGPPQPAPMPQQGAPQPQPQAPDINAIAQRVATGMRHPNPEIRRAATIFAQTQLPALREQARRAEEQHWREQTATRQQSNWEREFALHQARAGREAQGQTGLSPIYGTDANGNTVLMLPRNDGTIAQPALPPGVSVSPQTDKVDLGTEWGIIDRRTGQIIRREPKNVAGAEAARVEGRAQGGQNAAAPQAARTADETLAQIDGVLRHPALAAGTGLTGQVLNAIPGTPTYDFGQRVEQLKGRAFLQAFDSLRGGGQITELEGKKATDAIARLNTANSPTAFREALGELRAIVDGARQRAGARANPQQSGGVPVPGTNMIAEPPAAGQPRIRRYNPQTGGLE